MSPEQLPREDLTIKPKNFIKSMISGKRTIHLESKSPEKRLSKFKRKNIIPLKFRNNKKKEIKGLKSFQTNSLDSKDIRTSKETSPVTRLIIKSPKNPVFSPSNLKVSFSIIKLSFSRIILQLHLLYPKTLPLK